MIPVAGGAFWMGCNQTLDAFCFPYENPYHQVDLMPYSIAATEVSRAQWSECLDAGACATPACEWSPGSGQELPVVCVTHAQASAYCGFRAAHLCSEAQWERAARGLEGATFPWGEEPPDCELAVMTADCAHSGPAQVGSIEQGASPVGAFDMAGNVSEWTADWFATDYYQNSPGPDPTGPVSGTNRVFRGGSFSSTERYLRTSYRAQADPAQHYHDLGLRCCR